MDAMLSPEPTKKTRHYALRYLTVREFAGEKSGNVRFCSSAAQKADGLTKYCQSKVLRNLLGDGATQQVGC